MRTMLYAVAIGAAMLLNGYRAAAAQEGLGLFATERDCTTDVQSLCAGVKPGGGRVLACLQSHVAAGGLLRGLFDNSVEGDLGRQGMRG